MTVFPLLKGSYYVPQHHIVLEFCSKPLHTGRRHYTSRQHILEATKNKTIVHVRCMNVHQYSYMAEISENKTTFLDTTVFKGERFTRHSILDINTHYKPTETFQYTHFASCHPPGVKHGFIKGEAIRLLRTNSSKKTFEESLFKFKQRLRSRGYPENIIERSLSGVTFASRQSALAQKTKKGHERLLPFVTTYHPAVKNLKQILMEHWSLIQNQPLLKTIFEKPPIISYKKGKSLKDTLVTAKILLQGDYATRP